ncbi:Enolase-phosphatase E1 [Tyrophagus putrescentiae]|nr:Enolase-phosphatase E1 [Tyrophagus putrescentiae]
MSQLKVRKPKVILFDIIGTVIKEGWIDKVLFPYIVSTVDDYLAENWGDPVLVRDVELLRAQSQLDAGPAIVQPGQSVDRIRNSVADYVVRCLEDTRESEAIRIFRDVARCLGNWAQRDCIDLYVFSNGWSYAMKKFLKKTNYGDLTLVIKDFIDTNIGQLNDMQTYEGLISQLGHPPEDILFLTHSGIEGVAARRADLSVILVTTHRKDLARERNEDTKFFGLPYVRSFNELVFKRDRPMAPWDDAAGLSFVPRASNSLTSNGQIPHNFPVMESKPSIVLDEWLPAFVRKIIKSAKQDATKAFKGPSKK